MALSIVHPKDDIFLTDDLRNLRKNLDKNFPIIIGGRASINYMDSIREIDAFHINDLYEFRLMLKNIGDL